MIFSFFPLHHKTLCIFSVGHMFNLNSPPVKEYFIIVGFILNFSPHSLAALQFILYCILTRPSFLFFYFFFFFLSALPVSHKVCPLNSLHNWKHQLHSNDMASLKSAKNGVVSLASDLIHSNLFVIAKQRVEWKNPHFNIIMSRTSNEFALISGSLYGGRTKHGL